MIMIADTMTNLLLILWSIFAAAYLAFSKMTRSDNIHTVNIFNTYGKDNNFSHRNNEDEDQYGTDIDTATVDSEEDNETNEDSSDENESVNIEDYEEEEEIEDEQEQEQEKDLVMDGKHVEDNQKTN